MGDFSRRELLKSGGVIAIGLVTPRWLSSIAHADVLSKAKGGKAAKDTILVVCQLTGGNDGLNTIIPYSDALYYQLRPTIGVPEKDLLKINENLGFHPSLKGVAELYKEGKVAVIQNVGYPNPNRSHFKSMDIWQSASPSGAMKYGWIGRHFDHQYANEEFNPVVALGLSTEKPLALNAKTASIPCFASLVDVKSLVGDEDAERMLREIQGMDAMQGSNERVVQQANKSALDTIGVLSRQLDGYAPKQAYGESRFGQGFKQIAQLIATSPATRVVYFSTGGFDTHARQVGAHDRLLEGFSEGVTAFQREMETLGKADKVVVLVFSEFGRRVAENGSAGTDHGTAAPMFVIGKNIKGGMHGKNPNLSNLEKGDLQWDIDFRSVYAATLDQWMGGDSEIVLGEKFKHVPVF
jgi:uncharacterized protein (DUF1501 family)